MREPPLKKFEVIVQRIVQVRTARAICKAAVSTTGL